MVIRSIVELGALALVTGCASPSPPVELDLCAPPAVDSVERSAMDGADTWQVVVFGLRDEDVAFERAFAADGSGTGALLNVGEAIPPGQAVRLLVRGFETTPEGQSRMVALASSPPLQLVGGERVCLCVAPPETYGDACYEVFCNYSPEMGCTF